MEKEVPGRLNPSSPRCPTLPIPEYPLGGVNAPILYPSHSFLFLSLEVGPLNTAKGLGSAERCKLPHRGLGCGNRIWCI